MQSSARSDLTAPRLDVESLTVAMAIAPGVYSRNRFFELFKAPELRKARSRALIVRGIVSHLAMLDKDGEDPAAAIAFERRAGRVVVRYSVRSLHFDRQTELSELEATSVLYLAERAGLPGLAPSPQAKDELRGALMRLSGGEAALLLR